MRLGSSVSTVEKTTWPPSSRQRRTSAPGAPSRLLVHVWCPVHTGGVSPGRQVSQGVAKKRRNEEKPRRSWLVSQFSSTHACPRLHAARTRVLIVDLNRVATYPPQGERSCPRSIRESMLLTRFSDRDYIQQRFIRSFGKSFPIFLVKMKHDLFRVTFYVIMIG